LSMALILLADRRGGCWQPPCTRMTGTVRRIAETRRPPIADCTKRIALEGPEMTRS